MDNNPGNNQEKKEGGLFALLFATLVSLLVGLFVKKLFLNWCEDNHFTEKQGFILLFLFCWLLGLCMMVIAYVIFFLIWLFQ